MTRSDVAEKLVDWTLGERTGAIEWRDERRRRLFFFERGELVLLQSNLKSESPQRLAELHPELDAAALRERVAIHRIRGVLAEEGGEVVTHPEVAAPERQPHRFLDLLWKSAENLPPIPDEHYPRALPAGRDILARTTLPPNLIALIVGLEGDRTVDDIVTFGAADPLGVRNALAYARLLGAVEVAAVEVQGARIVAAKGEPRAGRSSPPPARAAVAAQADAESTNLDDLALMMQQAASVGTGAAALDDQPSDPFVVPAGHEVQIASSKPTLAGSLGPSVQRIRDAATHFDVLGVGWAAEPEQLRAAYLQLARDLHPDRWSSASEEDRNTAEKLFERVRAAWDVVGMEDTRVAYINRAILGIKTEEELAQERVREMMEADAEFKRGLQELNSGRLIQAHDLFSRARARAPEDMELRAYAGYTAFKVHAARSPEKAEAGVHEVIEAIRANDRLDQAHFLLGMIKWARGDEAGAKSSFIAALRIRPANPDALRELKRLQRQMEGESTTPEPTKENSGFFARLFGKKK